jgi:gentisate 1,2-dioxygenase
MSQRGIFDTVLELGGAPRLRPSDAARTKPSSVAEFITALEGDALKGLWSVQGRIDAPSTIQPYVWRWSAIREHLNTSGELMKLTDSPVRRALLLWNPGARDHWDTTNTLTAAVQMMQPGETVTTHRHIHSAMRFITHGKGATTTVNGERIVLSEGDVVLTPNWQWHDHANESDGEVIWMDGVDRPLVKLLDAIFFESYPDGGYQPVVRRADGDAPSVAPAKGDLKFSPKLVWRWNEIWQALLEGRAAGQCSPYDDVILVLRNPVTGGHVTPTFGCAMQMLRPGIHTKAHRHTTSAVYQVFRGRGYSIINSQRYDWEEGDYFALPHRAWHEHVNLSSSEPAVLFSLIDDPTFETLALRREEIWEGNGGYQEEA